MELRHIVDYEPALDIRNIDSLPRGLGCRYLLVVESHYLGTYIAKAWKRKMPSTTKRGEAIIRF